MADSSAGPAPGRMLKIGEVIAETTLSRRAIYRAMKEGTFPKSRKVSPQRVAWLERDVDAWKDGRFQTPD